MYLKKDNLFLINTRVFYTLTVNTNFLKLRILLTFIWNPFNQLDILYMFLKPSQMINLLYIYIIEYSEFGCIKSVMLANTKIAIRYAKKTEV